MEEYIVQWYDLPTKRWRQFGVVYLTQTAALAKAIDLYIDKKKKIAVRVKCQAIVWQRGKIGKQP